jgi:hypothetical protein
MFQRTAQYRPVGREEAVLQGLLQIALLEGFLLRNDLVKVVACV